MDSPRETLLGFYLTPPVFPSLQGSSEDTPEEASNRPLLKTDAELLGGDQKGL